MIRVDDAETWEVPSSIKFPLILCAVVVTFVFGSLACWSALAPIASAAIAPGSVIIDGNRKTIQHPDGGMVSEIFVKEGDLVSSGQVLLAVDGSKVVNTVDTLSSTLALKLAQRNRLLAERSGDSIIKMNSIHDGIDLNKFPDFVEDQKRLFGARSSALRSRIAVTVGEAKQAEELGKGSKEQIVAQTKRLALTEVELRIAQELARTGAGTARRVSEVSRSLADIDSEIAGLRARAAEADRKIASAALDGARILSSFSESIEVEIGENTRECLELSERLTNAQGQLKRLRLLAPIGGQVVNLSVHTIGAVIVPSSALLEIVPTESPLIIEAQVRPSDIGRVKLGNTVEVRVVGLDSGRLPRLTGVVTLISADRLTDRVRNTSYFGVRIRMDAETLSTLKDFRLKAGMAVNAMIIQEDRTLFQYLTEPLLSLLHGALRE